MGEAHLIFLFSIASVLFCDSDGRNWDVRKIWYRVLAMVWGLKSLSEPVPSLSGTAFTVSPLSCVIKICLLSFAVRNSFTVNFAGFDSENSLNESLIHFEPSTD